MANLRPSLSVWIEVQDLTDHPTSLRASSRRLQVLEDELSKVRQSLKLYPDVPASGRQAECQVMSTECKKVRCAKNWTPMRVTENRKTCMNFWSR